MEVTGGAISEDLRYSRYRGRVTNSWLCNVEGAPASEMLENFDHDTGSNGNKPWK